MVANSRAANKVSSFSSYVARKQRSAPQSTRTRDTGLQDQIKSLTNNINSNRTDTTASSSSSSYIDNEDYETNTQSTFSNSNHIQNLQNSIDSLRNLRQTQTGDSKVDVAQ